MVLGNTSDGDLTATTTTDTPNAPDNDGNGMLATVGGLVPVAAALIATWILLRDGEG